MFSGYIFWLILTKITSTEVIGLSSAVLSMSGIFTTVVIIGVPSGVQRFLGKYFAEQKFEDAKVFIKASVILVTLSILLSSTLIFFGKDWISNAFKIDSNLVIISIVFIATSAISTLFRSIVIASLKTKILPIVAIAATIAKIMLTLLLIYIGLGAVGVTIGFTVYPVLILCILAVSIMTMTFKTSSVKREVQLGTACKDTLIAGMANWIPGLIATIGSQLGLIVVLGWQGASQAGVYSIAFSIVVGISTGISVLSSIAFPTLSGMTDGRKRFAWRIIKMSLAVSLPFSSSLIFYSGQIMNLFGPDYVEGSSILGILLMSMLPTAVSSAISSLVYSYGNYKQVLEIGLASTIPRVSLYFILVPVYGGIGAALSYSAGSVVVFIVSAIIAKRIGMKIFWKDLIFMFIIPIAIGSILSYSGINYILGIIVTMALSYIIFLKMLILNRSDLQDALSILPHAIARPSIKVAIKLGEKLNRSF